MTLDEGAQKHRDYVERRRVWVHDPENKLAPWPKRRTGEHQPFPGVIDAVVEDDG